MRIIVSALMVGLLVWLVPRSLDQRLIRYRPDVVQERGPEAWDDFPGVLYHFGKQALVEGRLDEAAELLDRVLSLNVAHVDAWLRRAEVAAARGDRDLARQMLRMVAGLTPDVLRWKWEQALLARDLGLEGLFWDALNTLIQQDRQVNDALWLMEAHEKGDAEKVLAQLDPENREAYLGWLMRWRRAEDAVLAWQALDPGRRDDESLRLSFIHFLIRNDKMDMARELREEEGITNSGFEESLTRKGFDWRYSDREDAWRIRQVSAPVYSGRKALEVRFSDKANSHFRHVYQLVPVTPGKGYRLRYWWKSHRITTDQGVFVEVRGRGCRGLYEKGPMILGTEDWQQVDLEFEVPEACDTVLVRLRRKPSGRFDNKINGVLWLDDFVLEPLENP